MAARNHFKIEIAAKMKTAALPMAINAPNAAVRTPITSTLNVPIAVVTSAAEANTSTVPNNPPANTDTQSANINILVREKPCNNGEDLTGEGGQNPRNWSS